MKVLDKVYRNPDGYTGPLTNSYSEYEGKPRMVMWQELVYMAVDCVGMCKYHTVFLSPNHPQFKEFAKLIYLNTGLEFTEKDIWDVANRGYTIERLFNLREGMTRKDDWLSDRYFDEPTKLGLPVAGASASTGRNSRPCWTSTTGCTNGMRRGCRLRGCWSGCRSPSFGPPPDPLSGNGSKVFETSRMPSKEMLNGQEDNDHGPRKMHRVQAV
jgi:hypothetical protein